MFVFNKQLKSLPTVTSAAATDYVYGEVGGRVVKILASAFGSVTGPTGPTGPKGATGATGPTGATA